MMKVWETIQQRRALNRSLWTMVQRNEIPSDEVMLSRLIRSSLSKVNLPKGFEQVSFVIVDDKNELTEALRQAVCQVGTDNFNVVLKSSQDVGAPRFARAFWRFWLKVAKSDPAVCIVLSGLSKEAVAVLCEDEFDNLALEVFLSNYCSRFVVQGTNLRLLCESRDPVQDALTDWLLAEEMKDLKKSAQAKSRLLRWTFCGDSICDLSSTTLVNFNATTQEIDSTFDLWNTLGVGQESTFRLMTFLTGASRPENRRRWRVVMHPCRKKGSFQFPTGVSGAELSLVFEGLMGRCVAMGLSAVELMRVLPVVAVWAYLSAGLPCESSNIGRMTALLEKKYRHFFEAMRFNSLSLERQADSPQRLINKERQTCVIGCG